MVPVASPLADALLDAHIAFVIRGLTGPGFQAMVDADIQASLRDASRLTLNDVVTPAMIKATAKRYACDLELNMAVPELAGEIARAVHSHPTHGSTRLHDVLPDRHFEAIIDKLLELSDLRRRVLEDLASHPGYADAVAGSVMGFVRGWVGLEAGLPSAGRGTRSGASGILRRPAEASFRMIRERLFDQVLPGLDAALEEHVREWVSQGLRSIAAEGSRWINDDMTLATVRNIVLDVWEELRGRPVSDFMSAVSAIDVEDFIVIAYEYWHSLREKEPYKVFIDAGIDAFFDKYGEVSLFDLLGEIGITREYMVAEALQFGPHVINALNERGMLEPIVRRQLQGFYRSGEVERVVAALMPEAAPKASAVKPKPAGIKSEPAGIKPKPAPRRKAATGPKATDTPKATETPKAATRPKAGTRPKAPSSVKPRAR
jgi:hypothetical protein